MHDAPGDVAPRAQTGPVATAAPGHPARNQWVDVVRGLAIVGVVLVHSSLDGAKYVTEAGLVFNEDAKNLLSLGRYGVEVFFFISGWLLASIYGSTGSLKGRGYWAKRIVRILPLWVFFLGTVIAQGYLFPENPGAWGNVLAVQDELGGSALVPLLAVVMTLTFTLWLSPDWWNTIISGGWSIQAEIAHYVIFPIIRRLRLAIALGALVVVNLVTFVGIQVSDSLPAGLHGLFEGWVRLGVFSTLSYFLLGCAVHFIATELRDKPASAVLETLAGIRGLWLVPVYAVTILLLPLPAGDNSAAISIVVLAAVCGFVLMRVTPARVALVVVGRYSYFIYFAHFIVLELGGLLVPGLIGGIGSSTLASVVGVLFLFSLVWIVTVPLGWLSFRYFEGPFIRLARRAR